MASEPDDRKLPSPPKGTGRSGRRLWYYVLRDMRLELDVHEELLLIQAVRCTDWLDSMAKAMENAPLTVRNSRGDEVANPLLVEFRQQAQLLQRLFASLRLPTGLTEGGELERPQRRGAARGSYGIRGAV